MSLKETARLGPRAVSQSNIRHVFRRALGASAIRWLGLLAVGQSGLRWKWPENPPVLERPAEPNAHGG